MPLDVVILAAGKGKRMQSALPKVLHPLAGRPLLAHVLDSARALAPRRIVVVHGHGGDEVKAIFPPDGIDWVEQAEQLGTGHAVMQALPKIDDEAEVLVLYGDVPLVRADTLRRLAEDSAWIPLLVPNTVLVLPKGMTYPARSDGRIPLADARIEPTTTQSPSPK